jgi:hypothetical protein
MHQLDGPPSNPRSLGGTVTLLGTNLAETRLLWREHGAALPTASTRYEALVRTAAACEAVSPRLCLLAVWMWSHEARRRELVPLTVGHSVFTMRSFLTPRLEPFGLFTDSPQVRPAFRSPPDW